jgi:diguanylate cyclase (GGDEF)-like protein/PAS domain S-box-containing protein
LTMKDADYQFSPRVRDLYENSPFPLLVYQLSGTAHQVLLVSDGYCQMVQSSRTEAMNYLNQHSFSRVYPDDRQAMTAFIHNCHQNSSQLLFRFAINGSYHRLLATRKPFAAPNGAFLQCVAYADLTASGAEAELETSCQQCSQVDRLTGLPNINHFNIEGSKFLHQVQREHRVAAAILLDVNNMNAYNNRFGYVKGDILLNRLGQAMREVFTDSLICRYSQDQFVIITRRSGLEERIGQLNRQMKQIAADHLTAIRCGVYLTADQEEYAVSAVDKAHLALLSMSSNEKTACKFYDSRVKERFAKRDYIMTHLAQALADDWIKVDVQPMVNVFNHKAVALELFARWDDPKLGVLYPKDFLHYLEEVHLTHVLGLHVLKQACRIWSQRRNESQLNIPLVINLLTDDLEDDDFLTNVNALMAKYQIPRHYLCFDLALADDADKEVIQERLTQLKAEGYTYSFDTRTSSYSLINALADFDFDFVKFDMNKLDIKNQKSMTVLTSTIDLCKRLGCRPLFKGVDTYDQYSFIKRLGCLLMQGKYLMAPAAYEEITKRLDRAGLQTQSMGESWFYNEINSIDVFDPSYRFFNKHTPPLGTSFPVALFLVRNSQLDLVYVNPAGRQQSKQLYGTETAFLDALHARASNNALRFWDAAASCESAGDTVSWVMTTKDRLRYQMQMQLVASYNDSKAILAEIDGHPIRELSDFYGSVAHDVKKNDVWKSLISSIKLGMFWKDKDLRFLGVNQYFLDYYGMTANDVVGHTDDELGFNANAAAFDGSEQQLLQDGIPLRAMGQTHARGQVRDILTFKAPVYSNKQTAGLMGLFLDVTHTAKRIAELEKEASMDALTSLKNRHNFERDFKYLTKKPITVMMIDIDHFKDYNDNYGHRYGDEVLKSISQVLLENYGIGHCYRYGGDEFLILCDRLSDEEIKEKDAKVRQALEHIQLLGLYFSIHISVGYVQGMALTPAQVQAMIRQADRNLYSVKGNGRNDLLGSQFCLDEL